MKVSMGRARGRDLWSLARQEDEPMRGEIGESEKRPRIAAALALARGDWHPGPWRSQRVRSARATASWS